MFCSCVRGNMNTYQQVAVIYIHHSKMETETRTEDIQTTIAYYFEYESCWSAGLHSFHSRWPFLNENVCVVECPLSIWRCKIITAFRTLRTPYVFGLLSSLWLFLCTGSQSWPANQSDLSQQLPRANSTCWISQWGPTSANGVEHDIKTELTEAQWLTIGLMCHGLYRPICFMLCVHASCFMQSVQLTTTI